MPLLWITVTPQLFTRQPSYLYPKNLAVHPVRIRKLDYTRQVLLSGGKSNKANRGRIQSNHALPGL